MPDLDGFVVVNKQGGATSHDIVARGRRLLSTKKIGHTGTLDPMATGVLVLGVGQGTKLIEYLVGCEKEYEAEITLGATSSTFDADGEVVPTGFSGEASRKQIEAVLPQFLGKISQVPPKYSAIKIKGKPAYARARAGEDVEMAAREVEIFEIQIFKFAFPKLEIKIRCGSGTYIRSLAHDLGQTLGCGGHLTRLTRTRVGDFHLGQAIPTKSIAPERLLPVEKGCTLPTFELTNLEVSKLKMGQKIVARSSEFSGKFAGFVGGKIVAILESDLSRRTFRPVKVFN